MSDYRLVGKDFTPPDVIGKVTGKAKYAEDFRVDGMVYARMLTSPMAHGKVTNIDTSAAEAMDGVIGILTADDVPEVEAPNAAILTNSPAYIGDPILAVAALAVPGNSLVGLDFDEGPRTPAGVDDKTLDVGDFHSLFTGSLFNRLSQRFHAAERDTLLASAAPLSSPLRMKA